MLFVLTNYCTSFISGNRNDGKEEVLDIQENIGIQIHIIFKRISTFLWVGMGGKGYNNYSFPNSYISSFWIITKQK